MALNNPVAAATTENDVDSTLPEIIRQRALATPDNVAFVFLRDGETEHEQLTFSELHARVARLADSLRERRTERKPAVLLYASAPSFIVAFLACLYAGVIAVPAKVPRRSQSLEKLVGIIQNCESRLALTELQLLNDLHNRFVSNDLLRSVELRATDTDQETPLGGEFEPQASSADSVAFLQYTSGSTGYPKGVAVSHRNIIANQRMISESFGQVQARVFAGWLPFHHDMGLMANIIQPLFLGSLSVLMPPGAFIQKPVRWLKVISKYRAAISGGPNFAYDLCTRRCSDEELSDVDLSSWKVAFNGAELVRAATIARFVERYQKYGFSHRAVLPCYGMAEATLFVSSVASGAGAAFYSKTRNEARAAAPSGCRESLDGDESVSCGFGRCDQRITIVDPVTRQACADGQTGEIWLQGSNIARGYWRNAVATEETFAACLAPTGAGPFMRTGDLGFLLGGNLYVAGRIKELIIVRGRKFYPHDIEETVSRAHDSLRHCPTAAVSIAVNGEEQLVVIQEVPRTQLRTMSFDDVEACVREKVTEAHDINLHDLVFVKPTFIPKTSSGKTQRRLCATLYESGQLEFARLGNKSSARRTVQWHSGAH